jgi:hypothetical protein
MLSKGRQKWTLGFNCAKVTGGIGDKFPGAKQREIGNYERLSMKTVARDDYY